MDDSMKPYIKKEDLKNIYFYDCPIPPNISKEVYRIMSSSEILVVPSVKSFIENVTFKEIAGYSDIIPSQEYVDYFLDTYPSLIKRMSYDSIMALYEWGRIDQDRVRSCYSLNKGFLSVGVLTKSFSIDFICHHIMRLNINALRLYDLPEEFLKSNYKELIEKFGVRAFFRWQNIPDDLIETVGEHYGFPAGFWESVSKCPNLSEDFIRKHADQLHWNHLIVYVVLSEKIILENIDKIHFFNLHFYCGSRLSTKTYVKNGEISFLLEKKVNKKDIKKNYFFKSIK